MRGKTVVVLTDRYPFGVGEQPFVEPELKALLDFFNVVVVPADARGVINPACDQSLLNRIQILGDHAPWGLSEQMKCGYQAAFSHHFRHELPFCSAPQAKEAWGYLARATYMEKVLSDYGLFDLLDSSVFYSFWLNSSALGLALRREVDSGIKIMARTNGYDLYNHRLASGRQPFRKMLRESIGKILFSCQVGLDYFQHTFGPEMAEGQYQLARLGCPDHVAPSRVGERKFTVMSCSNVIPLKRVQLLGEGIALMGRDSVRWIHAGDGPELDKIRAVAEKESLDATFLGHVQNNELMDFYQKNPIDLFATMSSSEGGCPVSVTEALSFSMPILASVAGGGVVEQVDSSNGVLLGADPTPHEVADALTLFMGMGEERLSAMGRASHRMWARRYDVHKTTARVVELAGELFES